MPRPANMIRAVYRGTLPQGEEFQTGFWIAYSLPAPSLTDLQTMADDMATHFIASSVAIRTLCTSATTYDELRLYHYPAGGTAPATDIAVAELDVVGLQGGNARLPLQAALVATLRTPIAGRRYRGRMYWPVNGLLLVNHQADEATVDGVALDTATILSNVNDTTVIEPRVVVMSAVGSTATAVTAVGVDSRLDVQRRRAEDQIELFQAEEAVLP